MCTKLDWKIYVCWINILLPSLLLLIFQPPNSLFIRVFPDVFNVYVIGHNHFAFVNEAASFTYNDCTINVYVNGAIKICLY